MAEYHVWPRYRSHATGQVSPDEPDATANQPMDPTNEPDAQSVTYEASPSAGVISAVSRFKGVDPATLTPLQNVLDTDALDALFDEPTHEALTVSFEYSDCVIEVTSGGTITVRRPAHAVPQGRERARNILVLTSNASPDYMADCNGVLSTAQSRGANVLGVTFTAPTAAHLDTWTAQTATPARISLIIVGDVTRASTSEPATRTQPSRRIHIDTVPAPADLATLGIKINEQLSDWEPTDEQSVVCFNSITALLEATELTRAFRFLHLLTGRLSSAGAIAHFHLDPAMHDDQTVATLQPLFDTILEDR